MMLPPPPEMPLMLPPLPEMPPPPPMPAKCSRRLEAPNPPQVARSCEGQSHNRPQQQQQQQQCERQHRPQQWERSPGRGHEPSALPRPAHRPQQSAQGLGRPLPEPAPPLSLPSAPRSLPPAQPLAGLAVGNHGIFWLRHDSHPPVLCLVHNEREYLAEMYQYAHHHMVNTTDVQDYQLEEVGDETPLNGLPEWMWPLRGRSSLGVAIGIATNKKRREKAAKLALALAVAAGEACTTMTSDDQLFLALVRHARESREHPVNIAPEAAFLLDSDEGSALAQLSVESTSGGQGQVRVQSLAPTHRLGPAGKRTMISAVNLSISANSRLPSNDHLFMKRIAERASEWAQVASVSDAPSVAGGEPEHEAWVFAALFKGWLQARKLNECLRRVDDHMDQEGRCWQRYEFCGAQKVEPSYAWKPAYCGTCWYALGLLLHSGAPLGLDYRAASELPQSSSSSTVCISRSLSKPNPPAVPHVVFNDGRYHRTVLELSVMHGGYKKSAALIGLLVEVNSPPKSGERAFHKWQPSLEACLPGFVEEVPVPMLQDRKPSEDTELFAFFGDAPP